ncbi:RNA polymerase, sigma-24 subunit, ECF subfamily [Shewanella sediminis HAW-EB3]|uniref:RNA polymerase, sigma-24 subunit, ECF subfamily n=1 Tax=Shewanella sediminis (strain HAW-EB3) TaxID=425104 RepID=A8FZ35_SHESH|nr:RNA polymerase sigma factor [Shewanella sediminis]ABV38108.1 RNA polymerase, sigma-24 subunit, ECF subfamily [Shewanella sediminis HAW-EB3]
MNAQIEFIANQEVSELELIEKAKQGDKTAFKQIYLRHHKRVYGLCFRLSGQAYLAEEATQETFVRLWQKLPQFRGESQFTTWLHSMTVNQTLSSIQKHKSFWARFTPMSEHTEASGDKLEYENFDKLLLKLPERARIVFILFSIEGYKHDEIAGLLGIASGTSKAQYHRARKLLQEML